MFGVLAILGCIFLVGAVFLILLDLLRYRKAIGVVFGNAEEEGEDGVAYAPRIRFRTSDGIDREFRPAVALHSKPILEGTTIPVRYNPHIAWLNAVDRWAYRLYLIVLCTAIGGGMLSVFYWLR